MMIQGVHFPPGCIDHGCGTLRGVRSNETGDCRGPEKALKATQSEVCGVGEIFRNVQIDNEQDERHFRAIVREASAIRARSMPSMAAATDCEQSEDNARLVEERNQT